MKKIYEKPQLTVVQIANSSNVMALTSSSVSTGRRGIYSTTAFSQLN